LTDLEKLFKSVLEADREAVVLCGLDHTIVYMNPAAKERYKTWGGGALVGRSLLDCHTERSRELILRVVDWFKASREHGLVYTFHNREENKDVYMVALRDDGGELIGYYEKHEHRDPETMKLYDMP
jgi:PAS domain-containing protein